MIIESSAPTRVDLAGGTIDISPLYLFHAGASTVNFAIDLRANCKIETRNDDVIALESVDRGGRVEVKLSDIEHLANEPKLELLAKLVHFFKPETGFTMTTRSEAPAGAGLGGSSALAIAVIAALNHLVATRYQESQFITIASNVECQVIKVPTGLQDYHPAQFGGAMCLHFRPDGVKRETLEIDVETLEKRIVVCYTGEPRNSGTNNWEITKRHIDGDKQLFDIFEGIRDTSLSVREALLRNDWQKVGETLNAAHPQRKKLSPNITTPQMDLLIEKATNNGAIAAKVCGAGGGGCIAFFCEENERESVENAIETFDGAKVLGWKFAKDGLILKES
ncbi:MAG: GHMP kinase [Pyrinomonadaceae bacterium]|nr:GHMP kinase [Pyrinomonadaceae bacterium]